MIRVLTFLLCFIALPALAADPRVVAAENWLNNLQTAQARFTQINPDGQRLTGTFYLKRPGRLRFEYDAPVQDFIVADGLMLYYYDAVQRQASNAPIGSTLADFLLRKKISLTKELTVTRVREIGDLLQISVVQSADPHAGSLVLGMDATTHALRKWQVTDATGAVTQVDLKGLQTGVKTDPVKFVFRDPSGRTRPNQ